MMVSMDVDAYLKEIWSIFSNAVRLRFTPKVRGWSGSHTGSKGGYGNSG